MMSEIVERLEKAMAAVPQHVELPDDLRIPLHELQADTRSNFGRVAADGSVAGMFADHVLNKLSQVEMASYRLLYQKHEAASHITALEARVRELEDELRAAIGYMTNASIDLETGATKKTALATINGGIKRARAALGEKK